MLTIKEKVRYVVKNKDIGDLSIMTMKMKFKTQGYKAFITYLFLVNDGVKNKRMFVQSFNNANLSIVGEL